jgi:hypothetical protein
MDYFCNSLSSIVTLIRTRSDSTVGTRTDSSVGTRTDSSIGTRPDSSIGNRFQCDTFPM